MLFNWQQLLQAITTITRTTYRGSPLLFCKTIFTEKYPFYIPFLNSWNEFDGQN